MAITDEDFEKVIPAALAGFLTVERFNLPDEYMPVVDDFKKAAQAISRVIRIPKRVNVLIGDSPFEVELANGSFVYTMHAGVVNTTFNDMIFLDCQRMLRYPKIIRVACILEEFVHSFLNISNEDIASHVVCQIYPSVSYSGGKYRIAESDT